MADLAQVDPAAEDVFGGKACGLARLIAAGVRVPPGFAVEATTALPDQWPEATHRELRDRAAWLLEQGGVAVRSSAVGEDSAERSFAGMFETVLGVTTLDGLAPAAARCIASAGSDRVRAYAGPAASLRIGLVVQHQVAARRAGVCFTVDPAGRDRAIVVEAVAGTGDVLVSGRAQPERWRVYRSGLDRWEARRDGSASPPLLTAEEATEIAGQAAGAAERLGRPLDLEWALDAAGLWWLQARPVTAAVPPPSFDVEPCFGGADDGPVTLWANWNVRETMPDPLTPLNWSLWREVVLPTMMEDIFAVARSSPLYAHLAALDLVNGRIYWNMNALLAGPWMRFFRRSLAVIDARAAKVVDGLTAGGVIRPRRLAGSGAVLGLRMLGANLVAARRLFTALQPRRRLAMLEECGRAIAARPPVTFLSDMELLREMRLLAEPESAGLHRANQMLGAAMLAYAAADRAFRRHPEARTLLTAGIEGNPTTRISLGIDGLVEAARPLAALFAEPLSTAELLERLDSGPGKAWRDRLRDFMARFGHRGPREFDIGAPRWADDPTMIIDLVRAGLRSPSGERATDRLRRMAEKRRRAVSDATAAASWWRRPLLRRLARAVEAYMPLREAPKHYAMFVFQRMRQAALEMGARLAGRGRLEATGDVFFLEYPELVSLAAGPAARHDFRPVVAERRARHERHLSQKAPDFLRSDGVPVEDEAGPAPDGVLRGVAASAGVVSGPVRILRAPDPRAMADGDVIVMELADPGWTPLFPRAGAVVMEVGGLMCHAAVVARELGIPAVFGVGGATRLLRDGQTVTVDGSRGTVATSSLTPLG